MSHRRFNTRRLLPLMAGVFVAAFSFAFLINKDKTNNADAADLSKFNPGNIISDYVMSNYNSMTEEEIQAWLTAKNPCNNHDYDAYLRYSSEEPWRDWYWKDDHFVCISEELFGDGMVVGEGDTAAHILYETAQEYKINPQVLIVLLQKESGLITDAIPSSKEYRTATGYGCPDTAACDSKYFGFKNQVRRAAALFREVLDGGWTNYPVGINNILYNPNWDCGRLEVNIQNLATSALYRYTPYTPNQAALNAGYGTGDWCSSYGNRNFYHFFVDWFGNTQSGDMTNSDIPNGSYNIYSLINKNYQLSTQGNRIVNSNTEQDWSIEKQKSGFYTIKNNAKDLFLTAKNNGVALENKNNSTTQEWIIHKNSDSTYTIYALRNAMVLDVMGGANINNTNVQLYQQWGDDNIAQKWNIAKTNEENFIGKYYIYYNDTNKVMSIANGEDAENANIVAEEYDADREDQKWIIQSEDVGGYYTIINNKTGKAVDVSNGVFSNTTNVWQHSINKTCAQRWKVKENKDFYQIINACNGDFVLDLQNGISNIQIYKKLEIGNEHQQWKIREERKVVDYSGNYNIKYSEDKTKTILSTSDPVKVSTIGLYQVYDNSEHWHIEKNNDELSYTIKNLQTGAKLAIKDDVLTNKVDVVQLNNDAETCNTKWYIQKDGNGFFTIASFCNEKYVLDLRSGISEVQIYEKTDYHNPHQQWILDPIRQNYNGVYRIAQYSNWDKNIMTMDGNIVTDFYGPNNQYQQWEFKSIDGTSDYRIKNIYADKYIGFNGTIANKVNLELVDNDSQNCSQQWEVINGENGAVIIASACNRQYVIDLQSGLFNIQAYEKTNYNNPHQQWTLLDIKNNDKRDGVYVIRNSGDHNKVLEVEGYSKAQDANVKVGSYIEGEQSQYWIISQNDDKSYAIINQKSQKLLDVMYGVFENKSNVWQHERNDTCAQKWQIDKNDKGEYNISNACYLGYSLDLQSGISNVQIYERQNNTHQSWLLEKIE